MHDPYEAPETFDPKDFYYGIDPNGRFGMRCVADMTEDELRQRMCRMIHFGLWHKQYQAGVYARLKGGTSLFAISRSKKHPCGECHLQPGEVCDICGAVAER